MSNVATTHLFWITSRAAGTSAIVLASLTVGMGLTLSGRARALGRLLAPLGSAERRVIHESLSLASLLAIAVHGLSLLGDSYLRPSLADISIPFVSSYARLSTSAGIIAAWALALLGLSYYLRGRIGVARWRRLHRLTALAWLAGLVHSFTESGSDAGKPWFIALVVLTALPALVLLGWHLVAPTAPAAGMRGARPARGRGRAPVAAGPGR